MLFAATFALVLILFLLGFLPHLGIAYRVLSLLTLALLGAESWALFRLLDHFLDSKASLATAARISSLATAGTQIQHDLKNSLVVIDLALNHDSPAPEENELRETARIALGRIKDLADSLGDLGKIPQIHQTTFDLTPVLEDIAAELRKHSHAVVKCPPQVLVRGDALKFMEACFQICTAIRTMKGDANAAPRAVHIAVFRKFNQAHLEIHHSIDLSSELISALSAPLVHFGHTEKELLKVWCSARTIEAMGGKVAVSPKKEDAPMQGPALILSLQLAAIPKNGGR